MLQEQLPDAALRRRPTRLGNNDEMTLQTIELETAPNPTASIIVLHGLGADGNDFVPIAEELRLDAIGPVRFVFPHAPVRPVTINGGMAMRAWYDLLHADLVRREDEAGLRASRLDIEALITKERERGIAASRIVLAGFSQGCAMTLLTGLRHTERLAGLVGLSGYLPLADATAAERSAASMALPVFLVPKFPCRASKVFSRFALFSFAARLPETASKAMVATMDLNSMPHFPVSFRRGREGISPFEGG